MERMGSLSKYAVPTELTVIWISTAIKISLIRSECPVLAISRKQPVLRNLRVVVKLRRTDHLSRKFGL
jgi:hypothetical protein